MVWNAAVCGRWLGRQAFHTKTHLLPSQQKNKKYRTQQQKNKALFWTCHLANAWHQRRRVAGTPGGAISMNDDGLYLGVGWGVVGWSGSSFVRVAGWWGLGCRRHPRLGLAGSGYAPGFARVRGRTQIWARICDRVSAPLAPEFWASCARGPAPGCSWGRRAGACLAAPKFEELDFHEGAKAMGTVSPHRGA